MYTEYSSNNSGGQWWLSDEDWYKLEKGGWIVAWKHLDYQYNENGSYVRNKDGTPKLVPFKDSNNKYKVLRPVRGEDGQYRSFGALATTAYRIGLPLRQAALEWEQLTGHDSTDAGCNCCGQPHTFTEYDDNGKFVDSGPNTPNNRMEW